MANNKTYAEKLKDPRWQRRRLEILNRDNFTYQKCGDKENTLHIHHRWYKFGKEPWDYPDEILVTLCEKCHEDEEKAKPDQRFILNSILICEFFNTELEELACDLICYITEMGKDNFKALLKSTLKKHEALTQ